MRVAVVMLLVALLSPRTALGQAESTVPASGGAVPAADPTQSSAPPPTRVDASGGGVTFSSGVNSLTIGARLQVRWTLDDRAQSDTDTTGTGVGHADGPLAHFDVARARVSLSGRVYRPWLRYAFQFELGRTSGADASSIKDATIEIRPVGRSYSAQLGQFKAPFSLQWLTSSGRLQFVDRAITHDKFAPGRDVGAAFSGTLASQRVGYSAGLFNGSGESTPQTTEALLYVARVFVHPLGAYAPSEGSTDAGAKPVLHLAAGVRTGTASGGRTPAGVVEDVDNQTAVNGEVAFRLARISASAEYFWMRDVQQNPIVGPDIDSRGYYVQAGVMLVARSTELAFRLAGVDGDTRVDHSSVREIRGAFGYFWRGHALKVQADAGQMRYGAAYAVMPSRARDGLPALGPRLVTGQRLADTQIRVQAQVWF